MRNWRVAQVHRHNVSYLLFGRTWGIVRYNPPNAKQRETASADIVLCGIIGARALPRSKLVTASVVPCYVVATMFTDGT